MDAKTIKLLVVGAVVAALVLHALFLLLTRRPVLAEVVDSSLSDATRYGHRRLQFAMLSDALSDSDDSPPTETATIRLRYVVDGRRYHKVVETTVRKGDRPDKAQLLWYDPNDPADATDRGISGIGLGLGVVSMLAVAVGLI